MYRMFKRLRVRFVECDLKQNEVARAAGMAPSTLCSRMQGKQPFNAWEIQRVAEVLGIPREQIGEFFFEPSPKSKKGA
nr:MAG TPA: helix-turn-helix domain protein [Caudoviricetes sp.]